jgi:hypothetical protein
VTVRQVFVCAFLGPVCLLFQLALLCLYPMFVAIGWLIDEPTPITDAWEIVTEPPLYMFLSAYRGRGAAS